MTKQVEYETHGTARFYVPEGFYTIEDMEHLLDVLRENKRRQDTHLQQSMQQASQTTG